MLTIGAVIDTSVNGSLTLSGGGTLVLSAKNTYTGGTTVNGGTLSLSSTANNGFSDIGPGTLTVNLGATANVAGANPFGTGTNITHNIVINGGALNLAGGTTQTDTWIDNITLTGGAVTGTGSSELHMEAQAGGGYTNTITMNASAVTSTISVNEIIFGNAAPMTLTFDVADGPAATDLAVTAVWLKDTGAADTVVKTGPGTMAVSFAPGTLVLSGIGAEPFTINEGTVQLGSAGSSTGGPLGTTVIVSGTGAAVDLNGFSVNFAEKLQLAGTGIGGGGALTNSSATPVTYAGAITLAGDASIVADNDSIALTYSNKKGIAGAFNLTLDGTATGNSIASIIATTTGGVIKDGSGSWTLTGVSTYTGANAVNAGKLYVNSPGSLDPGSAVSVANLATLGGTGTVGGTVTVADGGIIEAGSAGAGTLTLGGLTFSNTGSVNFGALSSYTSAPGLQVTGSLNPTGGPGSVTLDFTTFAGLALNTPYKLIGYSGSLGGSGLAAFQPILPGRTISALTDTGSEIDLTITGTDFIKWTGAGTLANGWDTATPNWILNSTSAATNYIDNPGDTVVFDDSAAAGNTTVDLDAANVSPSGMTFNNSTNGYTLAGSTPTATLSQTDSPAGTSGTGRGAIRRIASQAAR